MDRFMTGPIIIAQEDAVILRQNILNSGDNSQFFENIENSMSITEDGLNTVVEFFDLDLSELDGLIEDNNSDAVNVLSLDRTIYSSSIGSVSYGRFETSMRFLNSSNSIYINADREYCIKKKDEILVNNKINASEMKDLAGAA